MKKVLIIGGGSWGTALGIHLAQKGVDTLLWAKDPEHRAEMTQENQNKRYLPGLILPNLLKVVADVSTQLQHVDLVLLAVPSFAFASVLKEYQNSWPSHLPLLWVTKGIEPQSLRLLSEVAEKLIPNRPLAYLSGPSFAKEVGKQLPTAVVIASDDSTFAQQLQQLFHTPYFRIYLSDDIRGAQLGGAIKNILAIAVGISDGMQFGANAKAGLITRGFAEMARLGDHFNINHSTLNGLSGLGDLVLSCTDSQSRNRRFGLAIGQGLSITEAKTSIGQVVEGIEATKTVYAISQQYRIKMPITAKVYEILFQKKSAADAVSELLARACQDSEV